MNDSQSRRIAKRVLRKTHEMGDWSLQQHRQFLYDGWNMIAEIDISISSGVARLHRSYAWGLDASGTLTGAGGVGGLLLTTHYGTAGSSSNVTLAPLYDFNSNVLAYADVTTSTITHRIDYDPFGNELTLDTLLPTEAAEEAPRFRFSTKYTDSESGLVYYGYRSYSPELGRWVNRDPIEERGGVNLYGMVGNDAVNRLDYLGQIIIPFGTNEIPCEKKYNDFCSQKCKIYGYVFGFCKATMKKWGKTNLFDGWDYHYWVEAHALINRSCICLGRPNDHQAQYYFDPDGQDWNNL